MFQCLSIYQITKAGSREENKATCFFVRARSHICNGWAVMAERQHKSSCGKALRHGWKCHLKSNWILCFGAVHMIMASIQSSLCWTFYPLPSWRYPPHHWRCCHRYCQTDTIICKIFAVIKIQFNRCKDESGMEMCLREFISLRPGTWTSKLQPIITTIIWMYKSGRGSVTAGEAGWRNKEGFSTARCSPRPGTQRN